MASRVQTPSARPATCVHPAPRRTARGGAGSGSRGSAGTVGTERTDQLRHVPRRSRPVPRRTANACGQLGERAPPPTRAGRPGRARDRPAAAPSRSPARRARGRTRGRAGHRARRRARTGTVRTRTPAAGRHTAARPARARPAAGRPVPRPGRVCGETITLRTSSWLRLGSSPVASIAASTSGARASAPTRQPAQLEVGARGEVDTAVAVRRGDVGEGAQGRRRHPAPDQAQPDEQRRRRPARGGGRRGSRSPRVRRVMGGADLVRARARGLSDLAAIAARASRSSDSGSTGSGRLPGAVAPVAATSEEAACSARHPHRCASVPDSHRVP